METKVKKTRDEEIISRIQTVGDGNRYERLHVDRDRRVDESGHKET
jgi:hypothetical protein